MNAARRGAPVPAMPETMQGVHRR
ncbi:hypothetical protein E2C01_100211 [Portunus trituberculatus]|uniref:Uncharacterized protein n=1 Tax=Portunus trituberculatus TaxID=210409 RepID=A0A5B7KCY8_PORTR|nr:hypothetical protein [Portunus trituberculatus]